MTTPDRPAESGEAATPGPRARVTLLMIVTALAGVTLAMICADATIGALVWAMLEMAGIGQAAIGWTEVALLVLSLVPAAWLFREALISEREMADWASRGTSG